MTKRSTPLSKKSIMALERACVHASTAQERAIAGFLRFCVGSRCRGGDATRIPEEPALDIIQETGIGYVDCAAHVTKRSRVRTETSRMGVDISGHSWGLCEPHWAKNGCRHAHNATCTQRQTSFSSARLALTIFASWMLVCVWIL